MKLRSLLLAIVSAAVLTGCVGVHSSMPSFIDNSPSVSLKQNNFHVVKHVQASASATYILGIGGLSRKALRQNAVADMMTKAELVGSQAVINVTTKMAARVITPFFVKVTVNAYGTVVQFDGPSYDYTVDLPQSATRKADYYEKAPAPASKPAAKSPAVVYTPAPMVTPIDLCQSGDIRKMSKQEQRTMLAMLVEDLDNDMSNAKSAEDLEAVLAKVEIVKTYYANMSKATQKDVDKLYDTLKKKLKKSKK